ncbi:hypothetical protein ACHHYP_16930 [Achlya hypogyna]|uniref:Uncharacterized protein n=1 Tax=Achlya hypogyna TaxID=1202772 RepID=A0A1V9ZDX1_ACHHY|nr:hypothetical protein ACHHYP_16930 [Achlya hypogyna]
MTCTFGPAHCFHEGSMLMVCAYVYAAGAAFAGYIHVRRAALREHGHDSLLVHVRRVRFFPALVGVAFASRAAWFVLLDTHAMQDPNAFGGYDDMLVFLSWLDVTVDLYPLGVLLWNKLATLLYISAFALLLQFWADMLDHTMREIRAPAELSRPARQRRVLVVAIVWMYVIEIALLLGKTFCIGEPLWLTNSDGWCTALFSVILALALGYDAYRLRRYFDAQDYSRVLVSVARRVTLLGLLCSSLFILRGILLVATPVASLRATSTPWLYYAVPELAPGCLVLALMHVKHDGRDRSIFTPTERTPLVSPELMLSV